MAGQIRCACANGCFEAGIPCGHMLNSTLMWNLQSVEIGGVSLHYAEGPMNGPPMVLLHGVTSCWRSWIPVLPLLGERFRYFALDHRGHGDSGWASNGYASPLFVEDTLAFIEHVVREPVILVGHSLGAMVALEAASQSHELIKGVFIEDPPLGVADGGPAPPWFAQYLDLLASSAPRPEKRQRYQQISPEVEPNDIDEKLRWLEKVDPEVLLHGADGRLFAQLDLPATLNRITCPLKVIRGNPTRGGVISDAAMARFERALPEATCIYRPEMGHILHASEPGDFARLLTEFANGIG